MTLSFLDRILLPLRLARARRRQTFRDEAGLGPPLIVEGFDPGFPQGEAAYNSIGIDRHGVVWFAIGTKCLEAGARLYTFDPRTSSIRLFADLDKVLGTPHAIPQGKVHVDLVPIGDAMIGATHIGYYDPRAKVEQPGSAPGYAPYPGGWFFAAEGDRIVPLAQAPAGEGIIAMSADVRRALLFALTWPGGLLLTLDLASRTLGNHGRAIDSGRICRSLALEPESGVVFWSDDSGTISRFDGSAITAVAKIPRGEMWRKAVWHPAHRLFYSALWKSATLIRFDPASLTCDEIGDLGGPPATLAFAIESDTIHALVTGPGVLRKRQVQLGSSVAHVTYDLASGLRRSSGPLRLDDGRWITQAQSLVIDERSEYSLCWVEAAQGQRLMLVRFARAA